MRVAVLGVGSIGGLIASRLARSGCEVLLCARGETAQALDAVGLLLATPDGRTISLTLTRERGLRLVEEVEDLCLDFLASDSQLERPIDGLYTIPINRKFLSKSKDGRIMPSYVGKVTTCQIYARLPIRYCLSMGLACVCQMESATWKSWPISLENIEFWGHLPHMERFGLVPVR